MSRVLVVGGAGFLGSHFVNVSDRQRTVHQARTVRVIRFPPHGVTFTTFAVENTFSTIQCVSDSEIDGDFFFVATGDGSVFAFTARSTFAVVGGSFSR